MSRVRTGASAGIIALTLISAAFVGATGSSPSPGLSTTGLPVFAPNEPLVLTGRLTTDGGGIIVKRPDGTGGWQLGTDVLPGVHKRGSWSPDGQHVLFVDEVTGWTWIAHLDGSPTSRVPGCDTPMCDHSAWSPDGTRVAFSRAEIKDGWPHPFPSAVGVEVVDLATGDVSSVIRLEHPLYADAPRWSPDGSRLVIGIDQLDDAGNEIGSAIAIVPVAGGEPEYLTSFESFAYNPDWGWVTDEIVFDDDFAPAETADIFLIRPDGSGLRQLTKATDGQWIRGARWTPDGTGITAYDAALPGGILIDPATGDSEPFATTGSEIRPLVRPLP